MAWLETGWAARAMPGETESGDRQVVVMRGDDALVAVIDGLGHGHPAAQAADAAQRFLESGPRAALPALLEQAHAALRTTCGAVVSAASIERRTGALSWLGVGNVEAIVVRAAADARPRHQYMVMRGGVIGKSLPPLRVSGLMLLPGDTLVLATDGVRSGFELQMPLAGPPQAIADWVLKKHGKDTDDALALVVRFRGGDP
jgi:negative regulator of sigma-B (phosphoserine phosphatase)